jgi:hypothetical protein
VDENSNKLSHLQDCDVFLPPQVFMHYWSHRGEHVVGVHHDVDARVEETEECRVATGHELDAPPDCDDDEIVNQLCLQLELTAEWHDAMVDHVKGRHLIISFAHHEEYCVEELCELAEEVPPATSCHLHNRKCLKVQKFVHILHH